LRQSADLLQLKIWILTEQDKERVKSILNGEHDADYYITQLDQKYGLARNA